MRIRFTKYHGTGNDFIMIDDRKAKFPRDKHDFIKSLCNRRYGIGADGLILLGESTEADFHMTYYNADGNLSSFCGNGSRCVVHFANELEILKTGKFTAIDGEHFGRIVNDKVAVLMQDVSSILSQSEGYILDTGSPHHVSFHEDIDTDFVKRAKEIRYSDAHEAKGINVNFVENSSSDVRMRTYERGVEDETHSCGTGVTAVALVCARRGMKMPVKIKVVGGELSVDCKAWQSGFKDIWLTGPAKKVYEGKIDVSLLE